MASAANCILSSSVLPNMFSHFLTGYLKHWNSHRRWWHWTLVAIWTEQIVVLVSDHQYRRQDMSFMKDSCSTFTSPYQQSLKCAYTENKGWVFSERMQLTCPGLSRTFVSERSNIRESSCMNINHNLADLLLLVYSHVYSTTHYEHQTFYHVLM